MKPPREWPRWLMLGYAEGHISWKDAKTELWKGDNMRDSLKRLNRRLNLLENCVGYAPTACIHDEPQYPIPNYWVTEEALWRAMYGSGQSSLHERRVRQAYADQNYRRMQRLEEEVITRGVLLVELKQMVKKQLEVVNERFHRRWDPKSVLGGELRDDRKALEALIKRIDRKRSG